MKDLTPLIKELPEPFMGAKIEYIPEEEAINIKPRNETLVFEEIQKLAELAKKYGLFIMIEGEVFMYNPEPDEPK